MKIFRAENRVATNWLQFEKKLCADISQNKKEPTQNHRFMRVFGGEQGIRTLEPLVTVTRFPVGRPRPN